jgi:hypothetical protein
VFGVAALLVLLIILFVSEVSENGFLATVFSLIIGVCFFFYGKDTWNSFVSILTVKTIVMYIIAGLVFAIFRVFMHGRNEMRKAVHFKATGNIGKYDINKEIKESVFRWWFLWPVSLIVWVIKDFINEIYDLVYVAFDRFFNSVMNLGIKTVKDIEPKENK